MVDPTIAKVIPGLILEGDPGAQRNRDMVYRGVQAVAFNSQVNEAYQLETGSNASTDIAQFPSRLQFPMRIPEFDQGEGHWFVSGEKVDLEVEFELVTPPSTNGCTIRTGWIFDANSGSTTLSQAATSAGTLAAAFQVSIGEGAGRVYTQRHELIAYGPQEQRMWWREGAAFGVDGLQDGSATTGIPRVREYSEDFSGTDLKYLTLYAQVLCADASDESVVDVRLKRVTAFITGLKGLND